jgi:hypothetical protein
MRNAGSFLPAYLHSTDETDQKRLESELLQANAAPLVWRALRQRLGIYVDQSCRGSNHTDAADLYQEAMLRLLQKLGELRSRRERVAVVAATAPAFVPLLLHLAGSCASAILRGIYPLLARIPITTTGIA